MQILILQLLNKIVLRQLLFGFKKNLYLCHRIRSPIHSLKMTLNQLVDALDAQVVKGDIIAAFDKFAADNCVTLSAPEDKTTSKAQKLEALRWFFNNVASVNRIERLASQVGKDTTDSLFVFDFTDKFGNQLVYNEVIRRNWKGNLVVKEQYLMGATLQNEKPAAASKKAVATKKAEPVADKKPATKKSAEPAADKKPAAKKAAEPTAVKKVAAKKASEPAAAKKTTDKKAGRK